MSKIFALACIGFACIANALQIPNVWDIWDIGVTLLVGAAILAIFAD